MNTKNVILIYSEAGAEDLVERAFSMGFTPIVRRSIEPALVTIRHEKVAGVLIDVQNQESDELEFILNLRDIDQYLPVIIIDDVEGYDIGDLIYSQPGVHVLEKDTANLENEIMEILES